MLSPLPVTDYGANAQGTLKEMAEIREPRDFSELIPSLRHPPRSLLVVRTPVLQLQRARVQSLVRELRFQKLCNQKQPQTQNKRTKYQPNTI